MKRDEKGVAQGLGVLILPNGSCGAGARCVILLYDAWFAVLNARSGFNRRGCRFDRSHVQCVSAAPAFIQAR